MMDYYVEGSRVRAKIFFGINRSAHKSADEKLNEWLAQNPGVKIVDFHHQLTNDCHSIAILYKTKREETAKGDGKIEYFHIWGQNDEEEV